MFVISIILAIITLIGLAVAVFGSSGRNGTRGPGVLVTVVAGLLTATALTIACYSKVPTRNVGIVTQYGKPTGEVTGAGIQWTKPWQDVDDWDATKQLYNHANEKTCVQVHIAGGGTACVEASVEWRADTVTAPANWASYKGDGDEKFAAFTDRRVNQQITASLGSLFSAFDPLTTVSSTTGLAAAPDLNALYRQKLTNEINVNVGGATLGPDGKVTGLTVDNPATKDVTEDDPDGDIVVQSVTFGFIHYDDATNAKLASYGQKLLDQRGLRVDQQNAELRKSIAGQSGVPAATQQCLDLVRSLGKGEPGLCMGAGVTLTKPVGE